MSTTRSPASFSKAQGAEMTSAMVRVLGPVQLVAPSGRITDIPSSSQRRLLGALALHAPRPVRTDWLCQVLDISPGALRTSVARLRRTVGDDLLVTTVTGYQLTAAVDAHIACVEIQEAGDDPDAIARALRHWAGPALEEFADEPWAVGDASRLSEIRSSGVETLADALLTRRRPGEAIAVLEKHIRDHPLRDRPRSLLIRALAASGRRTEALRSFQEYRTFLAESVGNEPSLDLWHIERRVAAGWDGIDESVAANAPITVGQPLDLIEPTAITVTLIGREAEMSELVRAADRAALAEPTVVLLSGESGIGKSTLLASFAQRHCRDRGWNVLYGRCDEIASEPLQPFRSMLGTLIAALPEELWNAHTARFGGDLSRLFPHQTRAPMISPLVGDEDTARHLVFEAAVDVISRAARIAPVALLLDDLHWAEATSLLMLRHLMHHVDDVPVLIVASFRNTGEAASTHHRAALADAARRGAVRIELHGLADRDLGQLVQARVPSVTEHHDVHAIAQRLQSETNGNPLYADQLLQFWIDSHQLEVSTHAVTVSTTPTSAVPSSLRDLVWQRVAALGDGALPVLQAASVLGVEFDAAVVEAMLDLEVNDVDTTLDRAVGAGLLVEDPGPGGRLRFTHPLVARSLLAEVGGRARSRMHARAASALLSFRPQSSAALAPVVARHFELGGMLAEALRWARASGDHANENLAPDEAADWYAKALAHADTLGRSDRERADLLVRQGDAATRAGRADALGLLTLGAQLAAACGDHDTVIRAALAIDRGFVRLDSVAPAQLSIVELAVAGIDERTEADVRARLLALLAQSLVHTGQLERRSAAAHDALALASSSPDRSLLARIAPNVLGALWTPGNAALRLTIATEAIASAEVVGDPHLLFAVHAAASFAAVCAGDAAQATASQAIMREIATDIDAPRMRWVIGMTDTFDATITCRFVQAEQLSHATYALATQIGDSDAFTFFALQNFVIGTFAGRHAELLPIVQHVIDADPSVELPFRIGHAIVCAEVGNVEPARLLLRDAMARGIDQIPLDIVWMTTVVGLAILAIELEDIDAAAWLLPIIEPCSAEISYNGITSQGPVCAYVGKLATLLGEYDSAEQHLRAALHIAEEFDWPYHRSTSALALADCRFRQVAGLDAEATAWLYDAERLATAFDLRNWRSRIDRLRQRATTTGHVDAPVTRD